MLYSYIGKYPLYDLNARIVDLEKLRVHENSETRLTIGTIPPKNVVVVGNLNLGVGDHHSLNIFFTGRNGSWNQELRLKKIAGMWRVATRVTRGSDYHIIYTNVDEEFPRTRDGHVESLSDIPANAHENPYFGLAGEARMF